MATVTVNDPNAKIGQATEVTITDLGHGWYMTRYRDYGTVTDVYNPGGETVGGGAVSYGNETLVSSSPTPPSDEARKELAGEISSQEQREAEASGQTDASGRPMIYRRDSTELTYPRSSQDVYENIYDVRKTQTINKDTPFTTRVGANFVQIIPSEMLIEHEGNVVTLGSVYKPEDLRQDIYTGMIGKEPVPSGDVIDLSGANQRATTESLISGRYQVQDPKGTTTGAMSFGTQEFSMQVQTAKNVEFERWYSGLSPEQKWLHEAKIIVGTTLLTLPLASTGIAMLPRAIQLGVAYGSSAYMSYDIIQGTSKEGLEYLKKPQFVVGIPLAIASGYVGFKLASRYGLAGKFEFKPEVVHSTQTITGVKEIGDNTGLFRGSAEVKYDLGGGLRGTKMKVVEKYDVLISREDLQTPMMRTVNIPSLKGPVGISQTGQVDVAILGGSRTVTTKNFLGAWTNVKTTPILAGQGNLVLFNQAVGKAEFPTFTAKAQYSEFASPDLKMKLYGRSLTLSTDTAETSVGISREIIGRHFDVRTTSFGASVTIPTQKPIVPHRFAPTVSAPKENFYVGLGDLSNQPVSVKAFNLGIGETPMKAIPLTTSDKNFIATFHGQSEAKAVGVLQSKSFAQPSGVIKTSMFDYLPKMSILSRSRKATAPFSITEPMSITRKGTSSFSVPITLFLQKQKDKNKIFPSEAQINPIPETSQRTGPILIVAPILKSGQKQRQATPEVPFSFGRTITPRLRPPTIKLPFPSLSLSLGSDKFKGLSRGLKTQYQPTLIAKEFKIYGKQPKFITGLEVRPMLRLGRTKKSKRRR